MKKTNQKLKKRYWIRDITIKPRTPKWERQFLMEKEAEEYFGIHASERHPIVKKYRKSKHFLKWTIKLLVPDFLIGHPNLWDNLKMLRKHPQFRPLRMALVAWLISTITLGALGIYSLNQAVRIFAATPVTDTFTDETKIADSTNMTVSGGQIKLSVIPWACGDTLTDERDDKTYDTVSIGSQCWMAEHINVGTRIAGSGSQTDNATIEKYCYSDSEDNCTTDGGLYQWNEAMQYEASCNGTGESPDDACSTPVQGICPSGWHIPSHYEYVTFERALCTSGTCVTDFPYDTTTNNWRGTNEGTKIKVGGSSGFEAIFSGYRHSDSSFGVRGTYSFMWSSLESGANAWRRAVGTPSTGIDRYVNAKGFGFSVRCIQD